ncbi:unnamed protein product [Coccothraustes coccothraustes]
MVLCGLEVQNASSHPSALPVGVVRTSEAQEYLSLLLGRLVLAGRWTELLQVRLVLKGQLRGDGPGRGQEHGEGREGRRPDKDRTWEGDMKREKEKSGVEKHRDKDGNRERHEALDGERQTQGMGREKRDRKRAGSERKNRADSGLHSGSAAEGLSAWPAVVAAPPAPDTPVPGGSRRAWGQGDCKVAACSPQHRGAEAGPGPPGLCRHRRWAFLEAAGAGVLGVPRHPHRHPARCPPCVARRAILCPDDVG